MSAPDPQVTRQLARFARDLTPSDLPAPVEAKVRSLLLDFVGTTVGGSVVPEVRALADVTLSRGADPRASVLGRGDRTSVPDAAFCNGIAGDVYEHQDGYRFGGYHPSHALPTLLAVAEVEDLTLEDLVTAAAVSYEVANRIGRALHPAATMRGWFPTAAVYGAAAAAARLLDLDEDGIVAAMGASAYFAPAVMIESIFGGFTAKPAFAGQIARSAAEGALAARAGLTGWPTVLEDPKGLVRMLGADPDQPAAWSGLGEEWTVLEVHQKRFAGCRHTHGAAQAAEQVVAEHGLSPADVVDVDVETYTVAKDLVDRPVTASDAAIPCTLSLPYVTAAAMVHHRVTGAEYTRAVIEDAALQELATRVRIRVAPDLDARYPEYTATRVTVTTTDGRALAATVDLPAGDVRAPLELSELTAKFTGYVAPVIGGTGSAEVLDLLLTGRSTRVRDLTARLHGRPDQGETA